MSSEVSECERCGRVAEGRRQWMFYRVLERFPRSPVARQFFCDRCRRIMRIYAAIGFTLLGIVLAVLVGGTIWASLQY